VVHKHRTPMTAVRFCGEMERLGHDFGVHLGKAGVELLDSIPSVDCCEVRGIWCVELEKLREGEGFPTDCFVIGNGVSCLDSTIDRSISQSS
jgi:hypothetical protein